MLLSRLMQTMLLGQRHAVHASILTIYKLTNSAQLSVPTCQPSHHLRLHRKLFCSRSLPCISHRSRHIGSRASLQASYCH